MHTDMLIILVQSDRKSQDKTKKEPDIPGTDKEILLYRYPEY